MLSVQPKQVGLCYSEVLARRVVFPDMIARYVRVSAKQISNVNVLKDTKLSTRNEVSRSDELAFYALVLHPNEEMEAMSDVAPWRRWGPFPRL